MSAILPEDGGPLTGHFDRATLRGRWLALLYWPRDLALLCASEQRALTKIADAFSGAETQFLAVARTVEPARDLPFPVLVDAQGELAAALGLDPERAGCSLRATFVADPEGTIRWVSVSDHAAGGSMREAAEVLRTLQGRTGTAEAGATGLIAMCAWCRRVRDDEGWHGPETYIRRVTGADFTHGICHDCFDEQRPR